MTQWKHFINLRIVNENKETIILGGVDLESCTARNVTDLQIVDFTSLLQVINKLQQACENQTCCNLLFADLQQAGLQKVLTINLEPAC